MCVWPCLAVIPPPLGSPYSADCLPSPPPWPSWVCNETRWISSHRISIALCIWSDWTWGKRWCGMTVCRSGIQLLWCCISPDFRVNIIALSSWSYNELYILWWFNLDVYVHFFSGFQRTLFQPYSGYFDAGRVNIVETNWLVKSPSWFFRGREEKLGVCFSIRYLPM